MSSDRNQFLNGYNGKELLKKYTLESYGTWKVRGEDPNPDMGGHHYQPDLGMFEGTLGDVIDYAVTLPNFWAWGSGGDITFVPTPRKIDKNTTQIVEELRSKKASLETELAEVVAKLNEFGIK